MCIRSAPNSSLPAYKASDYPALDGGKIRFAGECIALGLAPTRAEAETEDIAETVEFDLDCCQPSPTALPHAARIHCWCTRSGPTTPPRRTETSNR